MPEFQVGPVKDMQPEHGNLNYRHHVNSVNLVYSKDSHPVRESFYADLKYDRAGCPVVGVIDLGRKKQASKNGVPKIGNYNLSQYFPQSIPRPTVRT